MAIAAIALGANSAVAQLACDASSLASFCIAYPNMPSGSSIGCGAGDTVGASCPMANLLGTCTQSASTMSWYTGNGLTSGDASLLSASCTLNGGTWAGADGSPSTPPPIVGDPNAAVASPVASQTSYKIDTGLMPEAAVAVTAEGKLGSATVAVSLDLSKILSASFAADTSYNVYVAALVPGRQLGNASDTWFINAVGNVWPEQSNPSNWQLMSSPIASYLQGVPPGSTNQILITIVSGADITTLIGAEVYIGYGTSDTEMLKARRYRGVYKVE
ncbi:MAG: hypothetical protein A3G25_00800 [Betaproteobacteria bacterium RIFCSPLOWO2_12_FULL_63_13]|nr:MAG: hypothetical protein A3H32_15630 [Betaproteobacteria bacterium RIFCSPLOWO2_02_FULL_63_19]OGA48765.1 MAG: hypothetical protein A3G25_00800 [Betaproteobacteria bacterium RIFCSPLOWO2_12_FULL_63_13]